MYRRMMYICSYRRVIVNFVFSMCIYFFNHRTEVSLLWWHHFQEKSGSFQESGKVRQWLELEIRDAELGIFKEVVQNEIKNLKGNIKLSDVEVLTLQEEEMKRRCKEIVKYCYCRMTMLECYLWMCR